MKRLLETTNKQSIRMALKDDVIYQSIRLAYKEMESEMKTFHFSPEEIWLNSFIIFDQMLKDADGMKEMVATMWDDTFCDLRDAADDVGRKYEQWELETATSCTIHAVVFYMTYADDYSLIRFARKLLCQIAEKSSLMKIAEPLLRKSKDGCVDYIKAYVSQKKYISDRFGALKKCSAPVKPLVKSKDRIEAKIGIRKRLNFMKGALSDSDVSIMNPQDFNRMIEAVDYLIENNMVKQQDPMIDTNMSVANLRFTFYQVFKNEGKCIMRRLWIEFLVATFSQMQGGKDTLEKHFADKPHSL